METTKSIHNISANIFFLLAFAYIIAALSLRNDFNASFMIFAMRLLDVPFALISLLYGGSGLYLQINEGKEEDSGSVWGIIVFALCIIFFGAVVFVNFAFPSQL